MEAAAAAGQGMITQDFVFKQLMTGTSKKSGKPFAMMELHDPATLENMRFFLDGTESINTTNLNFKDKVTASFAMQFMYGELKPVLKVITKR